MSSENSILRIVNLLKESNKEFIESELIPFLRIPSNTSNNDGIQKAKNFILNYIQPFSSEIMEFDNGLFIAYVSGNIKDRMLIYTMYDTQPVNIRHEWISEPFGAKIKTLPKPLDSLGECIIARGAYNSKTPLICFLNLIKILKENDKLPISLILLFDAQEEIGSPTLLKLIENKKKLFKDCSDAYYPSFKQDLAGKSVLKLGYKGILSLTIKIFTHNKEPHSSFSSMIPNPAVDLISLLNKIYADNNFQIKTLKEPYSLTQEEEGLVHELIKVIDLEKIKNKAGIVQTTQDNNIEAFLDYLFKPTFNISTLKSGYLEEGRKNMVANRASCKIDIRFAHEVSVDDVFKEIEEIIENFSKKSKSQINLNENIGYESSRVNRDSKLVQSIIKSFNMMDYPVEIWPISAAAAPLSKIKKDLRINFITGGLGIGGYAHAPNEFVQLASIINNRISNFYFLMNYSGMLDE